MTITTNIKVDNLALISEASIKNYSSIPSVKDEKWAFSEYIKKINQFPILSEIEEKNLLKDFFENQNKSSGHTLLNSHLRLVVKIATQYKRYHGSLMDLIAEGNLGLLKALKNFSLEKEVRFSTYAMLWIKASIREYLLKSLSSIKVATTNAQKKILFSLSKARKFLSLPDGKLGLEDEKRVSQLLNVEVQELRNHERMIFETKEVSLNDTQFEEDGDERGDYVSSGETLESVEIHKNSNIVLKQKLEEALQNLPKREAEIVKLRILMPEKSTLEELSNKFQISKERVRQIQEQALKKLKVILEQDKEILTFL